jgi:hypothetical protein
MLETRSLSYVDGPVLIPTDNPFLLNNVKRIQICDTGMMIYLGLKCAILTSVIFVSLLECLPFM